MPSVRFGQCCVAAFVLLAIAAAQGKRSSIRRELNTLYPPPTAAEVKRISILTPNSWELMILSDGSGRITYGSSNSAGFPKNTFVFDKIVRDLRSHVWSQGHFGKDCMVVFPERDTGQPIRDAAIVIELFHKAYDARQGPGNIEEVWEKKPPATQPVK